MPKANRRYLAAMVGTLSAMAGGLLMHCSDDRADQTVEVVGTCDLAALSADPANPEATVKAFVEAAEGLQTKSAALEGQFKDLCNQIDTEMGLPPGADAISACAPITARIAATIKSAPPPAPGPPPPKWVAMVLPTTCTTDPGAKAACIATCAGPCDLAAKCDPLTLAGTCSGTCKGTCDVTGDNVPCNGSCLGSCSGMTKAVCNGECVGACIDRTFLGQCETGCNPPAGPPPSDAGPPDSGGADSGVDAGPPDSGPADSGADASDGAVPPPPPPLFQGTCGGTCLGSCDGMPLTGAPADGNCPGRCAGICKTIASGTCGQGCAGAFSGGLCGGSCTGTCNTGAPLVGGCVTTCSGRCTSAANSVPDGGTPGACSGICRGGCSAPLTNPICEGKLDCGANLICQNVCEVKSALTTVCSPVANFEIEVAADPKLYAALRKFGGQIAAAANTLKALIAADTFITNPAQADFFAIGAKGDRVRACVTRGATAVTAAEASLRKVTTADPSRIP